MSRSTSRAKRATLRDVATLAGVSVPTVSKVLHGASDVGPDTEARVKTALRELEYVPVARPLPQQADTIVVGFDTFGDEYETVVLAGVMREGASRGMRTVIDFVPGAGQPVGHWMLRHAVTGVRAMILIATRITNELVAAAAQHDIALVAIDPKSDSEATVATIGSTNWAGMASVTSHLLELGHRRIAFAGMDASLDYVVERFSGYRSSLERAGLSTTSEYVLFSDPTVTERFEDGRRIGIRLSELSQPPTAVVAMCDDIAFGVIEGARTVGLATPDDLSVAGFDDIPAARRSSPLLTTVHQPLTEMGSLAVRTAAEILENGHAETSHVQLATSLVVRNSTRALAGTAMSA